MLSKMKKERKSKRQSMQAKKLLKMMHSKSKISMQAGKTPRTLQSLHSPQREKLQVRIKTMMKKEKTLRMANKSRTFRSMSNLSNSPKKKSLKMKSPRMMGSIKVSTFLLSQQSWKKQPLKKMMKIWEKRKRKKSQTKMMLICLNKLL